MRSIRLATCILTTLAVLAGGQSLFAAYGPALIEDVPHVEQKPDFCGEACAEMYLRKLGRRMDQDFVFDQAGLDPKLGRGCYTNDLKRALDRIGFRTGAVWSRIEVAKADKQLEQLFGQLHKDLAAGVPSIICMRYDERPKTTEHFRLILGYDPAKDEIIYHEPATADGSYLRMKRSKLLDLWPLKYKQKEWTIIRLRLEPHRLQAGRAASSPTDADYAQHIRNLKKKLPNEDFQIVIKKPFVVIGDESLERVQQRAQATVHWAVTRIKRDYFEKDPADILDIWLFKDKESYKKHTWELFRDRPTTPYGYYSPRHKALMMNIATGGGTLVHEIVHPFMESNFSQCPSWFNEGLASLYEQSSEKDGHIVGLTNWRLRGLHGHIKDKNVPSFKTLCSTTRDQFYDDDPGTNYAQARYLCYYLQEQGLLIDYFHEFRKHAEEDPTGYETLVRILGEPDMAAFKRKWEKFVMDLRF